MPRKRAPTRKKSPANARRNPRSRTKPKPASTGNVHLYVGISLDGYIAAPDGGVDWLEPYRDARSGFGPFIKTIGSCIMGRNTFDHAVAGMGMAGGNSGFGMPTYVVTHRPLESTSPNVVGFTGDLRDLVATIRQKHPGGDIWLMGGGGVTRSFIDEDLIDIYSVAFVPALLGAGLAMFPPSRFLVRRLRLVRQHTYKDGVIELRYERS